MRLLFTYMELVTNCAVCSAHVNKPLKVTLLFQINLFVVSVLLLQESCTIFCFKYLLFFIDYLCYCVCMHTLLFTTVIENFIHSPGTWLIKWLPMTSNISFLLHVLL